MKIKSLQIKNFKSIQDLVLIEPNPFSVFVGPNGAGKSNIFEALLFIRALEFFGVAGSIKIFGNNPSDFLKRENFLFLLENEGALPAKRGIEIEWNGEAVKSLQNVHDIDTGMDPKQLDVLKYAFSPILEFTKKLQRIFLTGRNQSEYNILTEQNSINSDGSNLEKVLYRVLFDDEKRQELIEWLKILVPEFENIDVQKSEISEEITLRVYEKGSIKPFPKHLISDGTQNILALLAAVYQSDEPQFLCIEEPENGLHPQVIKELVNLFRSACEEKGHYIWLNTHSETLVRQLRSEELILVDKKNGVTQVKQLKGYDTFGLEMDEAWLTNTLNGGVI